MCGVREIRSEAVEHMHLHNDTCFQLMMINKADAAQLQQNGNGYVVDPYSPHGLFDFCQTAIRRDTTLADALVERLDAWLPNSKLYELAIAVLQLCVSKSGVLEASIYRDIYGLKPKLDKAVAEYQEHRLKEMLEQ